MKWLQDFLDGFKPAQKGFGHDPSYAADVAPEKGSEKVAELGKDEYSNTARAVETEDHGTEYVPEETGLKRNLGSRHIQFIALGGCIGTGLFIAAGDPLYKGGPVFLIVGFLIVATMLIPVVYALGELAAVLPVAGAFSTYGSRFIDPAWGFALGWNYYMQWLVAVPLEFTAATIIISYYDPDEKVPKGVWIIVFLIALTVINLFGVRGYGEYEFFASFIKVIACVGFIIFGLVATLGGTPGTRHHAPLGHRWQDQPTKGGFKGFCYVFETAAFAFAGTELVGLAAAETSQPRKILPKSCKQVVMRVLIFYILSLLMITFLVDSNDERLKGSSGYNSRYSPFIIVFKEAGVNGLTWVFNAVILISALSVANSSVYASSRTIMALAEQGLAPKFMGYIDRKGRPLPGVLSALLFGLLAFLIYSASQSTVFSWLLAISSLSTIFSWLSVCIAHIRFRHAWKTQGYQLRELPWASPLGIIASYYGAVINFLVIVATFYVSAFPLDQKEESSSDRGNYFFEEMLSLPITIAFYIFYKIWKRPRIPKLAEIDLHTGRRDPVPLEVLEQERAEAKALPFWKKVYEFFF